MRVRVGESTYSFAVKGLNKFPRGAQHIIGLNMNNHNEQNHHKMTGITTNVISDTIMTVT